MKEVKELRQKLSEKITDLGLRGSAKMAGCSVPLIIRVKRLDESVKLSTLENMGKKILI